MSKLNQTQVNALQESLTRMEVDKENFRMGDSVVSSASQVSNSNIDESIINSGETLIVPSEEELATYAFKQTLNGRDAYGVLCITEGGEARRLYLSSLKKRAVEYGEDLKPVYKNGVLSTCRSEKDLAKAVAKCATVGDIYKMIAGKKIKFTECAGSPMRVARYNGSSQIIGTRMTHIFDIEFVA